MQRYGMGWISRPGVLSHSVDKRMGVRSLRSWYCLFAMNFSTRSRSIALHWVIDTLYVHCFRRQPFEFWGCGWVFFKYAGSRLQIMRLRGDWLGEVTENKMTCMETQGLELRSLCDSVSVGPPLRLTLTGLQAFGPDVVITWFMTIISHLGSADRLCCQLQGCWRIFSCIVLSFARCCVHRQKRKQHWGHTNKPASVVRGLSAMHSFIGYTTGKQPMNNFLSSIESTSCVKMAAPLGW